MINIRVIKSQSNIVNVKTKGTFVLETYQNTEDPDCLYFRLYDPDTNSFTLLGSQYYIPAYIDLQNAIWDSEDIYFPALRESGAEQYIIDVYKYAVKTKKYELKYSFEQAGPLNGKEKKLKIFILSETCILIQSEVLDRITKENEKRMGHIRFSQKIIDLETNNEVEVKDENINNNGLNRIIPISASQIMTKTGFSYLEDDRFESRSETDALIESVFIHTTARFIADLSLGANTIDANLIMSAYYTQFILRPEMKGDYVYFLMVNPEEETSVSVFYNYMTLEQLTCRNESPDMEDPHINFVIDNSPYVKNTALPENRFLNLKTMEFDLSAMGEEFIDIIGELFLLRTYNRKKESLLEIYHYPEMIRVLNEKGAFLTGCNKQNDYYIYLFKES